MSRFSGWVTLQAGFGSGQPRLRVAGPAVRLPAGARGSAAGGRPVAFCVRSVAVLSFVGKAAVSACGGEGRVLLGVCGQAPCRFDQRCRRRPSAPPPGGGGGVIASPSHGPLDTVPDHSAMSPSALLRFAQSSVAAGFARSAPNAFRRCAGHAHAPDSHASLAATTWSTSQVSGVNRFPVQGSMPGSSHSSAARWAKSARTSPGASDSGACGRRPASAKTAARATTGHCTSSAGNQRSQSRASVSPRMPPGSDSAAAALLAVAAVIAALLFAVRLPVLSSRLSAALPAGVLARVNRRLPRPGT